MLYKYFLYTKKSKNIITKLGGWRSGSAVRLHRKGHRFESYTTHHLILQTSRGRVMASRLAHNQETQGSNPCLATNNILETF